MATECELETVLIALRSDTVEDAVIELQSTLERNTRAQKRGTWRLLFSSALSVESSVRERALAAVGHWRVLDTLYACTAENGQVRLEGLTEAEAQTLQQRFRGAGWLVGAPVLSTDGAGPECELPGGTVAPTRMTLCATRPPDEVKVGGVFRVPDAALSSEYIDEEELLPSTELDGSRDQTANGLARSDCSGAAVFAARQPCANCTCGRREQGQVDRAAQAVPLKQSVSMTNEKASSKTTGSCNKCHLGDAFRCASCPYLGLPPFKPGAPLKIESSLLEGDL
ncbi:hypothetical protein CCYA_CCYA05G1697 [Cyanidiococcus yangmingshanensis]|nr:hypothetical protein CCYA_CCYA05G1697 [Cyanidiococcus yangmingshanensis]